jgi:hypothetical protein
MSDGEVQRVSELLHGRPPAGEEIFLAAHLAPNGLVDWWISEKVSKTMTAGLAGELVDMLRDFLGDFIRQRG